MRIVAGEWGGRRIRTPAGDATRPTTDRVREAWMSILAPRLSGARVLDLFAGSGALGLEALSRGAAEAVFVEKNPRALGVLRDNIAQLAAGPRARVVPGDVRAFLDHLEPTAHFHIALADPPYEQGWATRLLEQFQQKPFARELWVEHRTGEPIPALPGLAQRRYGDTTLSNLSEETE
ncbi:MAG: 16S rRNA (guanine(966)-N(2))-methyltransferase RsmD [Gemmatimonadota bacterium]